MSTAETKPTRRMPAQVNVHQKASNDRIRELNRQFSKYGVVTKEDIAKFAIGKTHKYSIDRTYINLYHDNDRVIFQTPLLFVPYGPRLVESRGSFTETYQLDASFFNNQYDQNIHEFESWLTKLETVALRLLKKRSYLGLDQTGLVSLLKRDDYRNCNKLSLKIDNKLSSFYMLESRNRLGERINFKDLRVPCYAIFIAEISTIWIKRTVTELDTVAVSGDTPSSVWGLSLTVHAAQCVYSHVHARSELGNLQFASNPGIEMALAEQPLPQGQLHQDELEPPEHLVKYIKMVKLGIPKDAVKHKMILDGLDPNLLDNKASTHPIPPPPPPPPPPSPFGTNRAISRIPQNNAHGVGSSHGISTSQIGPVKITTDMLTSVKLKAGQRELSDKPSQKPTTQQIGLKVDLSDILNMKSKLKKRNPETEPDSYSKMFRDSHA